MMTTLAPLGELTGLAAERRKRLWRWMITALVLALFGAVRLPVETRLTQERQAAAFGTVKLNLGLREKIGQMGFLAALSGFRTIVADLLWIDANTAWQRVEYGRMNLMLETVTTLAPRNAKFWEESAWHMAYNASVYVMNDPRQPKLALKIKAQREYFMLGLEYAKGGIANVPNDYELHQRLALIYQDKFKDHCAASAEFEKASTCPHAFSYEKRFAAYELSFCPGHEKEAWERLRKLYDKGPQERLPTLEIRLKAMEEKLQLPQEQRVYKSS